MFNQLIIAGRGVRLAGAIPELIAVAKHSPVVTTVLGKDLLDNSLSMGTIGIRGTANHLLDEAKTIFAVGASLPIATMGYDYKRFNKRVIVYVNLEPPNEFLKCQFVCKDAKEWLTHILSFKDYLQG